MNTEVPDNNRSPPWVAIRYTRIMHMRNVLGMSMSEVGKELGYTKNAVAGAIYRGRRQERKALEALTPQRPPPQRIPRGQIALGR